jgi:NAD(P)-dependent dehydrogenase (short-subunit alcohol dehydrogenase family)
VVALATEQEDEAARSIIWTRATQRPATLSVSGKVVAITGAAGSLGTALAAAFAGAGARLVVLGDLAADRLEPVAASVTAAGATPIVRQLDVTDSASVEAFVEVAAEPLGRVDVMINNAGVLNENGRIHNITDADWRRVVDVNLMGTVHGVRAAVQRMRRQEGGGAIVNTASVAGISAWAYAAPYGATKAAIIQLTRVAAVEYARDRIRVNCVCPGTFLSSMHEGMAQEAIDRIAALHPLGLGRPGDLVDAFLYLAGDGARWTTGSALVVDGGYSAP